VKAWGTELNHKKHQELELLEDKIRKSYLMKAQRLDTGDTDLQIKLLEKKISKILLAEEELWRQRSRAIWLQKGDQNTKFFHQYVNHRRNHKAIWEIKDENDNLHSGQEALITKAVRHFKLSYSDTDRTRFWNR
jgi:hypothetical protein